MSQLRKQEHGPERDEAPSVVVISYRNRFKLKVEKGMAAPFPDVHPP